MRKILILILLLIPCLGQENKIALKGMVVDSEDLSLIVGANVSIKENIGVATDYKGMFTLHLPEGEHCLRISYIGYKTKNTKINLSKDKNVIVFKLEPDTIEAFITEIYPPKEFYDKKEVYNIFIRIEDSTLVRNNKYTIKNGFKFTVVNDENLYELIDEYNRANVNKLNAQKGERWYTNYLKILKISKYQYD